MIKVGDKLWLAHPPFLAQWEVIEIKDAGAVLRHTGEVHFTGYGRTQTAEDGTVLTTSPEHAWLGKAHWPATVVAQPDR
jgi:hypothetical protein